MDSTRTRASPEQFATLLAYMECHGDLARPVTGAQGRIKADRLWAEITNTLNAIGGGVDKTPDKWKKVWADWKSKTKKKALTLRRHASGTGGGPASRQTLSAVEERILAIIGPLAVEGQASVEELGFTRTQSSAPSQSTPPAANDPVYLEIIDETPPIRSLTPPPHGTLQPSNSWLEPSTSEGLSPDPFMCDTPATPPRGRRPPVSRAPATPPIGRRPPVSCAPANPPIGRQPPVSCAPATPPIGRQPPVSCAPATPPSTRRRLRSTTPVTPQSAASPRHPRVRARRRRGPTPFERAASEFAAVELRRLELEETRTRQQHERELRALEVEHERNQILSSLVNVAQAWLEYYRSRDERLNTE